MTMRLTGAARSLVIAAAISCATAGAVNAKAPTTSAMLPNCALTTTPKAAILSIFVNKIAVGGDTAGRRLLQLTKVSSVAWVTDEAKCLRATNSLDTAYWTAPHGGPVYMMQVGTDYAAFPADLNSGGNNLLIHLDSQFRFIAAVLFQ